MIPGAKAYYTGLFRHALDDKNRLTIPSAWRWTHEAKESFLATPHPDGYIAVLPPAEVEKLHVKISALALSDQNAQDVAARFFAGTQAVTFDKQGRINLSEELIRHAGIKNEAVLVGSLTKFNIYSDTRWKQVQDRTNGEGLGDLMRQLGI